MDLVYYLEKSEKARKSHKAAKSEADAAWRKYRKARDSCDGDCHKMLSAKERFEEAKEALFHAEWDYKRAQDELNHQRYGVRCRRYDD